MNIGALRIEIILEGTASLKDKRSIVKRLKDRIRNKFNVSVAEVDEMDKIRRAVIAVAAVSSDKKYLNGQLDKIMDFIEKDNKLTVSDYSSEVI